jgi:hypothetical protein
VLAIHPLGRGQRDCRKTGILDEVELDGQRWFAQGSPGMGEGLGFYATVQSVQVGGGGRGNDKHDFRVTAVANDPALSHVDAVVGANLNLS